MINKLLPLVTVTALAFMTPALQAKPEKTEPAKKAEAVNLAKIFEGKLVDAEGKTVSAENLAKAKYVAVYFSAHWCPPCRKFTPKLVEFVKENRKDGNFEVVFVSSDKDEKAMISYMKETGMAWGGVLGRGGKVKGVGDDINGIPHLRVFGRDGKIAIDTDYDAKVYPNVVLEKLKEKITK